MELLYLYPIFGAVILLFLWGIYAYNKFVKLIYRTDEAWADIDVQLKRRYDLIPNLINTVKGYAKHEQETLAKVTEMRAKAMQAEGFIERGRAENMLTDTLKSLFAVAENYPDHKANENFLELQRELTDTENKIQAARRFYNANIRDLNTLVETVPYNFVARMFNFTKREFFALGENESVAREPVSVSF